jgi:hypothetical protein
MQRFVAVPFKDDVSGFSSTSDKSSWLYMRLIIQDIFDSGEKESLFTEIREIIFQTDLHSFDHLVYKVR